MLRSVSPFRRAILGLAAAALLALVAAGPAGGAEPQAAPRVPLTRIAEVKKTWSDFAARSVPVDIEGVVTCAAAAGNFFLHDGTLGIHVGESELGKRLTAGDRVRVLGATRRGAFAPSIEPGEVVLLGRDVVPEPQRARFNDVASGSLDGQWLEIEGVVCDVGFDAAGGWAQFTLAIEGRRLRVTVNAAAGPEPAAFIDAWVRLRGVASGSFNRQRQLVEPVLRVPGLSFVTTLRPPPPDPFAAPVVRLNRLLGYSPDAPNPHRVRIRGVVTRAIGERVFFVREDALGLRVEVREPAGVAPGDVVEAVGFPAMAGGAAVLESAICRTVATGPAPLPVRPDWASLLDGTHSGDLVIVRARLVDWVAAAESATMVLQGADQLFRATLEHPRIRERMPEKNTLVDATGICVVDERDEWGQHTPRTVHLVLAGPSDLVVIEGPDWWTPGRLWRALAGVLLLLAMGLGWVWSLRRQVRRKRAIIEQQARHAAALEERSRIARDLHDTLEQGLTGLSLQLKVVEMDCREAPHQVGEGLEAARQMLRRSRALAHTAIRELRTDELARRDESLAAGLQRVVDTWRLAGLPGVSLVIEGDGLPLPVETERHLAGIAAEAVTNAVKHGRATKISVSLRCEASVVRLQIEDNGVGFDPSHPAKAATGGFGVIGMRERAVAIGATLQIRSDCGSGTTVTVELSCGKTEERPGGSEDRSAASAASAAGSPP